MTENLTIAQHPELSASTDYAWLRQKGLEYVQRLSGRIWTDYNLHDPGVTLLEQLCYAITELSYRSELTVADLLASQAAAHDPKRQAFHSAREALTINPLTQRDYRKLVIDRDGVKNAWLAVLDDDPNGPRVYANCKASALQYEVTEHPLAIAGLYTVMLELEDDPLLGKLDAGKIFVDLSLAADSVQIELRLPTLAELDADPDKYAEFRHASAPFSSATAAASVFISGNKTDDTNIQSADLPAALRRTLYATITFDFATSTSTSTSTLTLSDVPLRVWFRSDSARKSLQLADLQAAIADVSAAGPLQRYHSLVRQADRVLNDARQQLQAHRNLCEDFSAVQAVAVEDIAVCCDLELAASADIEAVLAEVFFRIESYFSPAIVPRSLAELLERGVPVDQIFEGPKLEHGFLDDAELDMSELKSVLHASDIISSVMDIEGVRSVRNFSMAKYDREGVQVGESEPWDMPVTPRHLPRFYVQASKFLVLKNGLSFLPDRTELSDVLRVLRPSPLPMATGSSNDLSSTPGTAYDLQEYYPVQYQLPRTYGVGEAGLPATATPTRVAQAKQLQAYLLVFEQLLANYLAQLANIAECFAVDDSVLSTYFGRLFDDATIRGFAELCPDLTESGLQRLLESPAQFLDRRNRFLDHLLARFAESFTDYADMLLRHAASRSASSSPQLESKQQAQRRLISEKISFLEQLPQLTHDRAKAADVSEVLDVCGGAAENVAGICRRIRHFLGVDAADDPIIVIEHLLLRARSTTDALLPICIPADCDACGQEDPYSFRLTIVVPGEKGVANESIEWRQFAENAIRHEAPAHLGVKICWVSAAQLGALQTAYCNWLAARRAQSDALSDTQHKLIEIFTALKSVYPPATLHDCVDGNDANPVFLNHTIVTSSRKEPSPP